MNPPAPTRPSAAFFKSFAFAWAGLLDTVLLQRNMRVHLLAALMVGMVGSAVKLGLAEKVTMIFCVLLVLFAEMLNTALEKLTDLAIDQFDERARLAKDAAAGGVLVLAIGTAVIFLAIVVHNAQDFFADPRPLIRQIGAGLPVLFLTWDMMQPAPRSWPRLLLAFAGASALLAWTLTFSESIVYTGMTWGFVAVAWSAGLRQLRRSPQPH